MKKNLAIVTHLTINHKYESVHNLY